MVRTEDRAGSADLPSSPRAAVTELFHHHYRRLVGLAGLMVDDRETAEEVVQDAFEALYRNWGRLRDPYAAVAYLNHGSFGACPRAVLALQSRLRGEPARHPIGLLRRQLARRAVRPGQHQCMQYQR